MGGVTEPTVLVSRLLVIPTAGGEVRHGMKVTDPGYAGFGEAYFSVVEPRTVKGWKRHRRMTLNLIVACGSIRFCIRDGRDALQVYDLGPEGADGHLRLTIKPGVWVAFGGLGPGLNMLLNIADLPHDPEEAETSPLSRFPWVWPE